MSKYLLEVKTRIPKPCIRTAYTSNLSDRFKWLYAIPHYTGTEAFQAVMRRYGIAKIFADEAAKPLLDAPASVQELEHYSDLPLKVNLFRVFGPVDVKILMDDDLKVIYFLKASHNVALFPNIGFAASERIRERKGEDCPSQFVLRRLVRGTLDKSKIAGVERHLWECPLCTDIVNLIIVREENTANEETKKAEGCKQNQDIE